MAPDRPKFLYRDATHALGASGPFTRLAEVDEARTMRPAAWPHRSPVTLKTRRLPGRRRRRTVARRVAAGWIVARQLLVPPLMHPGFPPDNETAAAISVLVVDDDEDIVELLTRYLGRHGLQVSSVGSAAGLRSATAGREFDVILLDLGLPDADGLDALRDLRRRWSGALLIISGRGDAAERAVGLELGADDFLAKPFDLRELLARIHSVQRRIAGPRVAPQPEYEIDGLRVDPLARDVYGRDGRPLNLTAGEFELFQLLAAQPGRAVHRDELLTAIHGRVGGPFDRAIDMQVGRLRRKVERDPSEPRLIRSVRGAGYMLGVRPRAR